MLKSPPERADPYAMLDTLTAEVIAHMRTLLAELQAARARVADLEADVRRLQDEVELSRWRQTTPQG